MNTISTKLTSSHEQATSSTIYITLLTILTILTYILCKPYICLTSLK